jgi:cytochrome c
MPPKKKIEGDKTKGEKIFKNLCAVCHSFAAHGTGPNQKGTPGMQIASKEGFTYSAALSSKKGKWTDSNLDKYIKSPADFAPGNAMAFAGVPAAKDRADIIAYLKANM